MISFSLRAPTRCSVLRYRTAVCLVLGHIAYLPTRSSAMYRTERLCGTMPGTETAHGAITLRMSFALSGTETAYGATGVPDTLSVAAEVCAYALLRGVRYWHSVS
eukprot:1416644-Rhodomonas_salina.2